MAWNILDDQVGWANLSSVPSDFSDGKIDWDEVQNKPVSFTPSTHNHDAAYLAISANAISASKLATARTISLSGDATGSATFDGSANAAITVTIADDSHNHTIANVDGLQTSLDSKSATTHNHTLDGLSNTTITSILSGEILRWNGSAWVNATLSEAGIAASTHNHDAAYLGISANAVSASKLTTARTLSLTGDATGSATFDGSANAAITVTIADDSHNHTIANVDGLQTSLNGKADLGTNIFSNQQTIDRGVGSGLNAVLRLLSGNTLDNRAYNLVSSSNGDFSINQTNDANSLAEIVLTHKRNGGTQFFFNGIAQVETTIRGAKIYNIPNTSVGLSFGELWRDANGFLRIV